MSEQPTTPVPQLLMQLIVAVVKTHGGELRIPKDDLKIIRKGDTLHLAEHKGRGEYRITIKSTNQAGSIILPGSFVLGNSNVQFE